MPILLVDLEHRPVEALGDLEAALAAAPETLAIVVDPQRLPEVRWLCRELGAVDVLSGPVPPPTVADRLTRLHALMIERLPRNGWTRLESRPATDREGLDLLLTPR